MRVSWHQRVHQRTASVALFVDPSTPRVSSKLRHDASSEAKPCPGARAHRASARGELSMVPSGGRGARSRGR
eukprot:10622668-Alexandrium_andersonii.AAC.1